MPKDIKKEKELIKPVPEREKMNKRNIFDFRKPREDEEVKPKAKFSTKVKRFTFTLGDSARQEASKTILKDSADFLPEAYWKIMLKRFFRNKMGVIGVILLISIVLMSIIFPLIWPDHNTVNTKIGNAPWSASHPFGTDQYGRDLWARVWYGLRFSLMLALVATLIDLIVGVGAGLLMGYSKTADKIILFIIKVISNIPSIILLILLVVVIKPSFFIIVFALTVTGWTGMALQIRAQVLRLTEKDWVTAGKVLGVPEKNIVMSFIPVVLPMIITQLVFTIPGVILSEASLGFIGLSIPNEPTLGNLIADAQENFTIYPAHLLVPSVILVGIVISVQLIGNTTQDILQSER